MKNAVLFFLSIYGIWYFFTLTWGEPETTYVMPTLVDVELGDTTTAETLSAAAEKAGFTVPHPARKTFTMGVEVEAYHFTSPTFSDALAEESVTFFVGNIDGQSRVVKMQASVDFKDSHTYLAQRKAFKTRVVTNLTQNVNLLDVNDPIKVRDYEENCDNEGREDLYAQYSFTFQGDGLNALLQHKLNVDDSNEEYNNG